jgi:hypothetical protein
MQTNDSLGKMQTKPSKLPVIALTVVVILLAAGFGYYYMQTSSQISNLNNQDTALKGELTTANNNYSTVQSQLVTDGDKISALNSNVTALEAKISTDEDQISTDRSQVNILQSKVASDNTSISSLSTQNTANVALISMLKSNVTSSQSAISSLNLQISGLNGQVSMLQTKVQNYTSLLSLSVSTSEMSSVMVSPAADKVTNIGTGFTVSAPGFVLITIAGAYTSSDVILGLNNTLTTVAHSPYAWETSAYYVGNSPYTLLIAVLPGTITPYILTNETGITPSISVTYYS